VYNQSRDSIKINRLFDTSLNAAENLTPELPKLYWLAQTHFLIGWYYHRTLNNRKLAKKHWKIMYEYADKALEIQEFSEGFRLKAEAICHLCMVTSVPWVIINGLRIKGYCEKALDLYPENGKAMFLLGGAKAYPPFWFGGNPREAIRLLKKALKMKYLELNDKYNIYTAMGVAYLKEKKYTKAIGSLEKSLLIYPGNEFSQSMLLVAKTKNGVDLQKYYPPEEEEK
jgi:tetratricopeptide (TPR) repeat protein